MPLNVERDGEGFYLEVEVWFCDPDLIQEVGVAKEPRQGCGYVMLQMTSETQIEECPGCGEEFPFHQTDWFARMEVVVVERERKRRKHLRPIKE